MAQCKFEFSTSQTYQIHKQTYVLHNQPNILFQTNIYQTERSLSKSWRDRSKTQSGFDVASVTASIALEKLQSANTTNVRLQLIYSHSLDCTRVPRESLASLVISLALVNDLPQRSIIKWFLPCSTSKHLFTWLDSYHIGIGTKTLGSAFTPLSSFPDM